MFFVFSKVIAFFIFPLSLAIWIGLIIPIWIKGFRNKILSLIPVVFLGLVSSFPVSQSMVWSLEKSFPPVAYEDVPESDVIVVLGGMMNPMSIFPEKPELLTSADRLTDGIILYKMGKGKKILFTGGSGLLLNQDVEEAIHAKKIIELLGVPKEDILIESKSRNTEENAEFLKPILEENHFQKIILVTSAFHMKRSLGIFHKKGIEVFAYPTDYRTLKDKLIWESLSPSSYGLDNSTIAIKEWVGILAYKIKGYM